VKEDSRQSTQSEVKEKEEGELGGGGFIIILHPFHPSSIVFFTINPN